MSDQWPNNPGQQPPTPPSTPPEWGQAGIPPLAGPPVSGQAPGYAPAPVPPAPPKDPNRPLLVAAAVIVVLLLVAVGAAVFVTRSGDDVAATGPTSTTTTTPSTTKAPGTTRPPTTKAPTTTTTAPAGPPATQAELDAAVADLSTFVEKQRGEKFQTPVKVDLASEEDFNQRLLKDFEEEEPAMRRSELILKALGLIPADADIVAAQRQLLGAGVLGFYDPETKELVIRGVSLSPFVKQTIVHELTHALDDQLLDLDRPEYDDRKDEISFGFRALAEGNARVVEDAWLRTLTEEERKQRTQEEIAFAKNADLSGIPLVLLKLIEAPYDLGQTLVEEIMATGGKDTLDASFKNPPLTSRNVIHPEDYLDGKVAIDVTHPQPDGELIDEGVFGELMTAYTLEDEVDPTAAGTAAQGWDGDWYVAWKDGDGGACIRINYRMESPSDLTELQEAYEQWAKAKPKATVEKTGPDALTVTSCTATAGGGESPA